MAYGTGGGEEALSGKIESYLLPTKGEAKKSKEIQKKGRELSPLLLFPIRSEELKHDVGTAGGHPGSLFDLLHDRLCHEALAGSERGGHMGAPLERETTKLKKREENSKG